MTSQFGLQVELPLGSPMLSIVKSQTVGKIEIGIRPIQSQDRGSSNTTFALPHRVFTNIFSPVYVDFLEKHRPWIKANFGGDPYLWPPLLNFGRAVRNWISHHHGHVHFDNPKAPPVTWHHLAYSPSDEGRLVVGGDLEFGDLVILLFEIGRELDRLGCPLDP